MPAGVFLAFVVLGAQQTLKASLSFPQPCIPVTVTASVTANLGNSEFVEVACGLGWNPGTGIQEPARPVGLQMNWRCKLRLVNVVLILAASEETSCFLVSFILSCR